MYRRFRSMVVVCWLLSLTGCGVLNEWIVHMRVPQTAHVASSLDPTLVAKPPRVVLAPYRTPEERRGQNPDLAIAVAGSGGGYRAANLMAGVLLGLEKQHLPGTQHNLLHEVDYFSTVSGSGFAVGLYLSNYLRHVLFSSSHKPYHFAKDFFARYHPLKVRLTVNHAPDLTFGYFRSLRLESKLGHELLQIAPHRELTMGDIFIPRAAPRRLERLPLWVPSATILQNVALFQFSPDVLSAYHLTHYLHNFKATAFQHSKRLLYGFDLPMAVAMTASASYPYAVAGSTFWSRACHGSCHLHLFDGGIVDNLGLLTAIDLLRQDKAKVKLLIIVDAFAGNRQPFSKHRIPPRKLALFSRLAAAIGNGFQRNMRSFGPKMAKNALCHQGAQTVLVAYLDLSHYPDAARIPTSMWMDPAEQALLIKTGEALVKNSPVITHQLRLALAHRLKNCHTY